MIQPIYNNVPYEDDILNYEPFVMNGYCPPKHLNVAKRHSAPNGGGGGGGGRDSNSSIGSLNKSALNGSSLSSRSNSDSSESSKSGDVIYVSANAVKYSASKYGILMKREKILFVDHTRKYWAAVLSSTMYVYNGEKELKPCLVVHLEGYTARDLNGSSGNRNKDWVFEVVCPGKKTYQVIMRFKFSSKIFFITNLTIRDHFFRLSEEKPILVCRDEFRCLSGSRSSFIIPSNNFGIFTE